jgi:hypothetical protein
VNKAGGLIAVKHETVHLDVMKSLENTQIARALHIGDELLVLRGRKVDIPVLSVVGSPLDDRLPPI